MAAAGWDPHYDVTPLIDAIWALDKSPDASGLTSLAVPRQSMIRTRRAALAQSGNRFSLAANIPTQPTGRGLREAKFSPTSHVPEVLS